MLTATFQHLKGIGAETERNFWRKGIVSWEDFEVLRRRQLTLFDGDSGELRRSRKALQEANVEFFAKHLPRSEHYRIALAFPAHALFLDIETTGLSKYYDTITLVGWSKATEYGLYVKGDGEQALKRVLAESRIVVTFNGSLFDIPFLRHEFRGLRIPSCHIDLRYLARRVGLAGGQKAIEELLGIARPAPVVGLKGEAAPQLWHRYRRGDLGALQALITYNHADVENMKAIFDAVVERLIDLQVVPEKARSAYRFSAHPSKLKWADGSSHSSGAIEIQPFRGNSGPLVTFRNLQSTAPELSRLRVVGIDLVGSESRMSGWCFLDGNLAVTQRIGTDSELIQATLRVKPNLISIDSPLSLPAGRTKVTDDDPGREAYGIMRHCERVLKKRGINVYPCLIKSMQGLTARGIRLANHFRRLGFPVIESYPGAAQDIMNIPRKQAGEQFLAAGLAEFGIDGGFLANPVSHDELDAITSAVVGCFFLSGQFEALGNDHEEYLIIPQIGPGPDQVKDRLVIGFSGPIAAGKTTAARYIADRGFHYVRYSLVLEDMLRERGLLPSRETLQQIGERVNRDPGQRWLNQELLRRCPPYGHLVIDGLRFPEDHAFMVESFGRSFIHVHLEAPMDTREERYLSAGRAPEEFTAAVSHPVEARVAEMVSLAHVMIPNAAGLELLYQRLDQLVETISKSRGA